MANLRTFEINNLYHNYSRGVNKNKIFLCESDFYRFYKSIFIFNTTSNTSFRNNFKSTEEKLVHIDCFTLMPNHFHIVLKEIKEGGISKFLQKLLTSYSMYFNKKYGRTGSLFENRFKDKLVSTDSYYNYLREYIKNNCIKLIKKDYNSREVLYENIILTQPEKEFVKNYKFSYFNDPEVAP